MKLLTILAIACLPLTGFARDPGTGSNTTVGPGPTTPASTNDTNAVMGGGTPGNMGINTLGIDEPTEEEQEIWNNQEREEEPFNSPEDEVTDQDAELNTIQE